MPPGPSDPNAASQLSQAAPAGVEGAGGLSERQMELSAYWSYFRAAQYEGRAVDWNGHQVTGTAEHAAIAREQFIPPGFTDPAGSTLPLKFRKPTVPYHLCRVIVKTFTGLLFGAETHPKIGCPDDVEHTEDWLTAFAEETRLWSRMRLARDYGGAMGTACGGLIFRKGKPIIEVHDPRWCEVKRGDDDEVLRFEKRYLYPKEFRDPASGDFVKGDFWYRRVIDAEKDVVWEAVPAERGLEPDWDAEDHKEVAHGLGFCPIAWVHNILVQGDLDGDPDCLGIFDTASGIDMLMAQAHKGTISNMDPTPLIKSDTEVPPTLRKGSDNALVLPTNGDAHYMELDGKSIELAMKLVDKLREQALEVAQCVLDTNFDGPARTEAEVTGNFRQMINAANDLREQYGEMFVKRLLDMALRAARKLGEEAPGEDGMPTTRAVKLRPKVNGPGDVEDRDVGEGQIIELKWPPYFQTSPTDTSVTVKASAEAAAAGLISKVTAARKVAPMFGVEDVAAEVKAATVDAKAMANELKAAVDKTWGQ
jgi:hypothetical protein